MSKRRVSPEDVIKCEERYSKSRAVNSIVTHVAHKLNRPVEELYEKVVWPLDRTYGHSYDAFKLSVTEAAKVFEGIDLDPIVMRELEANIARRLTPQPVKIRADVEVSCFGYEGIDAVKNALRAGEALSTENIPIKIKLVAPPLYVLVTHSTDKTGGIALMEQALEKIAETIQKSEGNVTVKMKPKAVSAVEDEELAQLMARVEKENTEVQGDECVPHTYVLTQRLGRRRLGHAPLYTAIPRGPCCSSISLYTTYIACARVRSCRRSIRSAHGSTTAKTRHALDR